ncbi:thiamine-phosphate synthase family protein [Halorarius litoreus]|uniref:thiamine-phosphate synthase family protein n=1 Tax=Halorarius litoreus TaxID=2962676 RepID=UPI0020CFC9FB|nr:thiamine-phosphate synthase family protein [Halorarius litoreus]
MRRLAPTDAPVVCTVGASDPRGATGVGADLQTVAAHGAFGTSVTTAIGAEPIHTVPVETVELQLDTVLSRFGPGAVKLGRLPTTETIDRVVAGVAEVDCPVVVDLAATAPVAAGAVDDLLAAATLATVTADAADGLTGVRPTDEAGQRLAGQRLLTRGADAALVTGSRCGDEIRDTLVTPGTIESTTHPCIDAEPEGAGDALTAAIAARLALGEPLPDAVGRSLAFVERAVRYAYNAGETPVVNHAVDARDDAARDRVREQVADAVAWFTDRDVSPVVPEVGLQVVGATPHAESADDCAAVEGRIVRVRDGVDAIRGVRFGASTHVAGFLLAAREHDPRLRYAVNCRFDGEVADAMDALGWDWVVFDGDGTTPNREREAKWAFAGRENPPVAVADRGGVGVEPMVKVVGDDHRRVAERVVALADELR